jgi:hypothetical protein
MDVNINVRVIKRIKVLQENSKLNLKNKLKFLNYLLENNDIINLIHNL